jgi:hypothetical protein
MINPDKPAIYMPPHVWGACTWSSLLGLFNLATGIPVCVVGSFSGPHIFFPGVVQAVSGVALLVGWQGLLHRREWARWLLLLVSALMLVAIPTWIAWESWQSGSVAEGATLLMVLSVFLISYILIAISLASTRAGGWFKPRQ